MVYIALIEDPVTIFLMEGLENWFQRLDTVSAWVMVPGYLALADFYAYWAHRLLHRPELWHSHAWHHSPRYLYFLSGLRAAPFHIVVMGLPYVFAFILLPYPDTTVVVLVIGFLHLGNQHLLHSNIKVPYPRLLEFVLVTPRMHFVHHSRNVVFTNSNYGFVLSVWDRIFGTLTDPDLVPTDDELGIGYENSNWRLMLGLPAKALDRRIGS